MKTNLLPVLFIMSSYFAFSQAPAIQWQKSFGGSLPDKGNSIRQTTDGGYVMGGETNSVNGDITVNNGNTDYWVVKADASGALQWQKTLGGAGEDRGNAITQAADGGYLIVGASSSGVSGDITAVKGLSDFWIAKLSATGTLSWQKNMGGTNIDEARAVETTTDGGFIIVGDSRSNNFDLTGNNGNTDFWVVKIDAMGGIQWQKNLGGSGTENAYAVQQTSDGGYVVTGQTNSTQGDVSGNNGAIDVWVVKLSATGTIQWQKCLGGSSNDYGTSIKQTSDGGYIFGGKTDSNNGNVTGNNGAQNVWLVKLTSTGTITWQKCYGGTGFDGANSVQPTNDGGYIFAGEASSNTIDVSGNHGSYDFWVVKTNSVGVITWQKCLGGSVTDIANSVQQTSDNGYVIGGRASSSNGDITNAKGLDDFWIVKLVGVPTPTLPPVTTGLNENDFSQNFSVFPNPAENNITIINNNVLFPTYKLILRNVLGKLVFESTISTIEFNLDLSQEFKGVYFLTALTESGEQLVIKKVLIR